MMSVVRALMLSSQDKARFSIYEQVMFSLYPREKYRLIVSRYSVLRKDLRRDVFTVELFAVAFDIGKAIVAENPYKTEQFESKEAFLAYLKEYDFSPDTGWYPVEEVQG